MTIARRRFISIAAAASGAALAGLRVARADVPVVEWRGRAMGASASIRISHESRAAAEELIRHSVREIQRLEGHFSLYRADSTLADLNRRGALASPPAEMLELLAASRRYALLTQGAFDPTVQPLWTLYRTHFERPGADPAGPGAAAVAAALDRVGIDKVRFGRDRIAFAQRGMALTFNGIAQGYITDRVVGLLRAAGIDHSLVDIGEPRALGTRPDGAPWRVGIADPHAPERSAEILEVVDQAVATSGGYGFGFDAAGRFNHLFDPRNGGSPNRYASVTVIAPTATAADALSTACSALSEEDIRSILPMLGNVRVRLTGLDGDVRFLSGRGFVIDFDQEQRK
jgi:thiamine biosynthesis lipoprotein